MATAVTAQQDRLPAPGAEPTQSWPPSLKRLNALMIGDWFTAELPEPISKADQSWISNRIGRIDGWLSGDGDRQAIASILAGLFAAYPSAPISDTTAGAKVRIYLAVLEDRPVWAIEEAAKLWLKGDVDGAGRAADFPPSAARLRELATEAMRSLFAEKAKLQLLTRAKVVVPTTLRKAEVDALLEEHGFKSPSQPRSAA